MLSHSRTEELAMLELKKDDQDLLLFAAAADACEEEGRHEEAKAWRLFANGTVTAVNDPRQTVGTNCDLLVSDRHRGAYIDEDLLSSIKLPDNPTIDKYVTLLSKHLGKVRLSYFTWEKAFERVTRGLEE